ncbi:MAG: hypothetical protein WDN49_16130 [Acetobacteraceae bacterium]
MADPVRLTTTDILDRLVSFDTTSRNTNLPLINWVRAYLDGLGVPYRLSHDPTGEKANLHAIIGPHGPAGSRCPAMWTRCRWTARPGPPTRSACAGRTAAWSRVAPRT